MHESMRFASRSEHRRGGEALRVMDACRAMGGWGGWYGWRAWLLLACCLFAAAPPAHAHKASDAYLQIQRADDHTFDLRWDIALRDLDAALDLDTDANGKLNWGEVRSRLPQIQAFVAAGLRLDQGNCSLGPAAAPALERRVDGAYLVLRFAPNCRPAGGIDIEYRLFRDIDPTHRGLLRIESPGNGAPLLRSLDPAAPAVRVEWPVDAARASAFAQDAADRGAPDAAEQPSQAAPGSGFFRDGMHHILIGYDHVLFLICLLLPSVLRRAPGKWTPVDDWREAAWPMLGVVTMFTVAHSITLALASLKIVSLSPRIIEPAIAVTIILAAVDNIRPVLGGRRKLFSFLFGLIHGFGFASVLAELDLPVQGFATALLQFNLGVEAGQLLIVGLALLLLLGLRHWRNYAPVVLRGGSAAAVLLAAIWLGERVMDVKLLPFS
ncbi:conserved membrane hypothetical protein [Burkholderiales bacterium 8X]|nr:conserved membrane hypothetical protein [Burkholderiales bacterium 8X]